MNYIKLVVALFMVVTLQSCFSDFEEINTDPNAINAVTPDLLLTSVLYNTVRTLDSEAFVFTTEIMNQNLLDSRNPTNVGLLNWRTRGPWEEFYAQLRDIEIALPIARESGNINQEAVFLVTRAWIYSILTDLYGDIPYSDLVDNTEVNLLPSYDLQEDIYPSVLEELRIANSLFDGGSGAISGDILFNGDTEKWRKFCNSLRLRLLLRVSNVNGFNAASEFSSIYSDNVNNPIMESNSDNAVLDYSGVNESIYIISTLVNFNGYFGSELLIETLKSTNDNRLEVYFDPSINSIEAGNPEFFGWSFETEDNFTGDLSPIDPVFNDPEVRDGIIMTYSELEFVLSEAAQRGIIADDAAQHYQNAITASFDYWGVQLDADYLVQPNVQYNGTLERILTQKWIAGFMTPYESWFDYRRTGFPEVPVDPNAGLNSLPLRFGYPDSEISLNATNYEQAVSRIGSDEPTTSIWILE